MTTVLIAACVVLGIAGLILAVVFLFRGVERSLSESERTVSRSWQPEGWQDAPRAADVKQPRVHAFDPVAKQSIPIQHADPHVGQIWTVEAKDVMWVSTPTPDPPQPEPIVVKAEPTPEPAPLPVFLEPVPAPESVEAPPLVAEPAVIERIVERLKEVIVPAPSKPVVPEGEVAVRLVSNAGRTLEDITLPAKKRRATLQYRTGGLLCNFCPSHQDGDVWVYRRVSVERE